MGDPVEAFKEGWWAGTVSQAVGGMATVLFPSSGEVLKLPAELVRRRYSWMPDGSWALQSDNGEPLLTGLSMAAGSWVHLEWQDDSPLMVVLIGQ